MPARVWIAGEGNNELGTRSEDGSRVPGVLEALLAKVCPSGWQCAGTVPWRQIRKFRAGGARGSNHGDFRNVLGLVLEAYEQAADAVAFSRDVDSDPEREPAVATALTWIRHDSGWLIEVIGGVAKPALEGWILALRGVSRTDELSRASAARHLAQYMTDFKSTEDYVAAVERTVLGTHPTFELPDGSESLRSWLASAYETLNRLVHGTSVP
jgi:hypothetical protein